MMKKNKNYDDSKIFSEELLHAIDENKTASILKRMCDGDPKNINPLKEIPEPQMRLYGLSGAFESVFFDTKEKLMEYAKTHNIPFSEVCVIEFLGNVAGRSDVIREISRSGRKVLYAACDEDGYGIYNYERSVYRGEFVWEYNHGSISALYAAFRDRGITFEDDVYAKIDERNQKFIQLCRERNFFNMGKK